MVERVEKKYKPLFEVRLLHHFWLDQGKTPFESLPRNEIERTGLPEDQKHLPTQEVRLQSYDARPFLSIMPTPSTSTLIAGIGGIVKVTALGCMVCVPEKSALPSDAVLEFVVTIKNSDFFNYTALTLLQQKIYEFAVRTPPESEDQPAVIKIFRYKENVPVLSNVNGAARQLGGKKRLFLSIDFPEKQTTDQIEFMVRSNNNLLQLISDDSSIQPQLLNDNFKNMPVFVHQDDIPKIVAPNELKEVPRKGILLTPDIPDNVWALVRLSPLRNDDDDFSFVNKDNNMAKVKHPVFEIHFKNRSTFWQYLKKQNGEPLGEPEYQPLSHFGNAGKKQKPSVDRVEPKIKENDPAMVEKLVSNIFI